MHIGNSIPRPVIVAFLIVVALAALPKVAAYIGTAVTQATHELQVVAVPAGIFFAVLGGILHFSPFHREHAVKLVEGAVIGIAVIALAPSVLPHLATLMQTQAPHWVDAFFGVFGA